MERIYRIILRRRSDHIIYSAAPHNSVAVADHWRAVRFFAGFTGWVGTIVVTQTKASFWTDGRYVLQAQREMADTAWNSTASSIPGIYPWWPG